jgi:hypothetical protein
VHVNVKCVDFYVIHKCGNYGYKFIYVTKRSYHHSDLCETYCHSVVHYHGQMFQNLSKSDRICISMGKI